MNPESLDSSIQGILSALYPPFEATAPTVLSQLFRVIEERYRGDALQCLLDFLIPAKHILESVQQAACASYTDLLFCCEGWPLCLHERVVIQLASLNPLLLHPGDFYLQVTPFSDQSARIVVKSLLEEHRQVEETPVPETSYSCIFTEDWLRDVNEGRQGTPLRRCLLSTDQGIVKVAWEQVARPEFVDKPKAAPASSASSAACASPPQPPPRGPSAFAVETRILPAKDGIAVSLRLVDGAHPRLVKVDPARPVGKPVGWVSPNTWDARSNRELEGDYVDLVEFSKENTAPSPSTAPLKGPVLWPVRPPPPVPCNDPTPCARATRFSEEPCTPCMRRRLGGACGPQELRCRYRESYLAALQNPVSFEKGSALDTLEEPGRVLQCCHSKRLGSGQGPCGEIKEEYLYSCQTTQDSKETPHNRGKPLSHSSSTVSETSRRCPVVTIPAERSKSDICPDMIPSVHVVQCKKTTAFGLVSPKPDRRRSIKPDAVQASKAKTPPSSPAVNGHQKVRAPQAESTLGPLLVTPSPKSWGQPGDLLPLGIACLPGSRDRTGRAVVELYGDCQGWASPLVSSLELCKLILYLHSVPRKEVGELGMTLVTDARKTPLPPVFYKALLMVQEQALHAVHCVLLLVDKDTSPRPEKHPGLQMEVVTSLKALHKTVEGHQLTSELEGTYPYNHTDWLQLYQKLDPFVSDLQEAAGLLQRAIRKFDGTKKIDTVQDVQQRVHEQKTLMKEVLEDARLVSLQREGGAILARLRREEFRFSQSEDYRDAMDSVTGLYNQVEERVHILVKRSNESLQRLDFLLQLRELEARFTKIREWFFAEGEQRLLEAESVEDSVERLEGTLHTFKTFLAQITERKQQAMALVTEAETIQGSSYPETEVFLTMVHTFKSGLADFLSRAERCRAELETMVSLCHFCKKATELANDCRQHLDQMQLNSNPAKDSPGALERYRERFGGEFSVERFHQAKAQACSLKGSRGMRVWNVAWLRCQEARQQLEERLQDLLMLRRPLAVAAEKGSPGDRDTASGSSVSGPVNPVEGLSARTKASEDCRAITRGPSASGNVVERKEEPMKGSAGLVTGEAGSEWFPWHPGLGRSLSEGSGATSSCSKAQMPTPAQVSGQPSHRVLHAAQHFQLSRHGSFCSEESCCHRRVEGLESVARDPSASHDVGSCGKAVSLVTGDESTSNVLRLQRITEELLLTEREYVRSLGYVMVHYFPLLERPDVPQDLRGQRGRIFGNLEKLHDFHRHFFLKELEGCLREPLRVGRCFLRHRESFGLYALYSKNKPQSDSLLIHHGHDFFQQKQLELGDKMDLSSYLLKPVQRISKYSLLLQDLLKECEPQWARERDEVQAALEVIRFQLRHGNDLLAMDDIQECDVNLKEQGELIRQDEFLVSFRKRKCFRHVFLFQDLILFSKTKKTDVGNDVYIYKQSFKTCDIGMTHNSGESGLCFEIWFRRRKSQDTYILQIEKEEVKEAWTSDLEQILWEQAMRSRELRMRERVFMGMGSKPFMDIQPSEAAICDRAINYVLPGRELKVMSSSGVSGTHGDIVLSRPNSIGSGSSASTSGSNCSSSSGRGSLPPIGYLCNQSQKSAHGIRPSTRAVEEDDSENESESIHLLLDSSESSGESISGFSCSDHSCLSAVGGEAGDSSNLSSLCSKVGRAQETNPHFRKRASPVVSKKKTFTPTKPLALNATQGLGKAREMVPAGKSTEV